MSQTFKQEYRYEKMVSFTLTCAACDVEAVQLCMPKATSHSFGHGSVGYGLMFIYQGTNSQLHCNVQKASDVHLAIIALDARLCSAVALLNRHNNAYIL